MSGAGTDLIGGYLAELRAGLWVPAAEAELIVAEAEDHLRETAAVGMEIGMTELEAHQAAISSFGPVRAVIRAHRRRTITAGDAVLAAWKLIGLLGATVGAGGLAAVFLLHSLPVWAWRPPVPPGGPGCQCSVRFTFTFNWAVMAMPYAATAAGGLALLATRQLANRRLARRGISGRDALSPAVTAIFFLLVSALLLALNMSGVGALTVLDHPDLIGLHDHDRSPGTGGHHRRVPGGGPRLLSPDGGQAGPVPARIRCARSAGPGSAVPGGHGELLPAGIGGAVRAQRDRRGVGHQPGGVGQRPALVGLCHHGRSPRTECRRRRVPGGGRCLRCPGGPQADPARAQGDHGGIGRRCGPGRSPVPLCLSLLKETRCATRSIQRG